MEKLFTNVQRPPTQTAETAVLATQAPNSKRPPTQTAETAMLATQATDHTKNQSDYFIPIF